MNQANLLLPASLVFGLAAQAAILRVGPQQIYKTPCQALAAAVAGDLIEIEARGNYAGDVCAFYKNNLTIRGIGGWVRLDAAGKSAQDKAIWVVGGNDNLIENIEFTGARSSVNNGAGIRFEGTNVTIRNCHFHHNQNGILTRGDGGGNILVEHSLFGDNGTGDGYAHNMYIGHAASFTLRYSYSKAALGGQLVKSRAVVNYILYNRLSSESAASSYQIDFSNGGTAYVIGNLLQQGPNEANHTFIGYGLEGVDPANPGRDLYVVNNTFVNDAPNGPFIRMGAAMTTPAVVKNNIFAGPEARSSPSGTSVPTWRRQLPRLVAAG